MTYLTVFLSDKRLDNSASMIHDIFMDLLQVLVSRIFLVDLKEICKEGYYICVHFTDRESKVKK